MRPPLRTLVDIRLRELLPCGCLRTAERLNAAIHYAVFPGGRRMRPLLSLIAAEVVGGDEGRAMAAACAVEMLHASSLILDDLPAMDDAAIRRGRTALHLVFGEDLALLAALALFNQAYSIFGARPELVCEAAACIGMNGMIGGQAADLAGKQEGRNRKTSGLMRLTLTAGALACGADRLDVDALGECGDRLGEAYQIYDDVLDEHQDALHQRRTSLAGGGIEASRELAARLVAESKDMLYERFGDCHAVQTLVEAIDTLHSPGLVMMA